MHFSCRSSVRPQVLCVQMCMFYSTMCLVGWPLSEAARLRCGSDLLSDLIFVCGDRGIYLGKGTWSGYGARPRGKGIVDQCCKSSGCELQHLEMYCAKPKGQEYSTAYPSTTTATHTTTKQTVEQQFQVVFHKRLQDHLVASKTSKTETQRKKTQASSQRKRKSSNRRNNKAKASISSP
ncbi:insulin-like growth factor 3 isoform X1 [Echeneis naucrates]|uniref:insulin-like growth factor 3 isoform X1 n=2 Tax=Echeneis naucrates TaxID=173247 RepID=UPI0011138228|nr:insulin-like growth factor I isoform X1 [Echeneis naucrates]XP_029362932.1 insulin-like growth factor I isoform X1 [Echeneis naucrates]